MTSGQEPRSTRHDPGTDEIERREGDLRDAPRGARRGGELPEGTATDVSPPEGTSVDAPQVQGIHRPRVGPGGADFDEADRALPNRERTARRPAQPSAPGEQPPLRRRSR